MYGGHLRKLRRQNRATLAATELLRALSRLDEDEGINEELAQTLLETLGGWKETMRCHPQRQAIAGQK